MDGITVQLGEHLRQWRIVLGLSQELAADRANLSMPTLRRIERGDPGVRLGSFLALADVLGLSDRLAEATDPLETDLGRLRAHLLGRQRARRSQ
ncbi:XRE family transcriptional regulator [Arthrobacter sp. PAMC25564]|uniref:helix-turn-helix domain-containing protein n=1 Tax=Arthrobacter sp. PAMC25564 TaxID=2565366 RepID=UPI0010A2010B|nr:helix-turn-helix transcriptional regulator [Arthrobacter sp. PAMC25564]QCB97676.1 XRE family transcriptional regulator [Arthrobacter sp. PAMC25564]